MRCRYSFMLRLLNKCKENGRKKTVGRCKTAVVLKIMIDVICS